MAYSTDREVTGELGLNNCGIQSVGGASYNRVRKDFTLLYVAKGRVWLRQNGTEYPVNEGQSLLFLPGCCQSYRFDEATENLNMWVHFGGSFCDILTGEGARIITASDRNEWESNIERLVRAHSSMEDTRALLCLAYLRVLVSLLVRDEKLQHDTVKARSRLHSVLDRIHTSVGSDIDWDACAASCYLSRDRFNHVFREYVGTSPETYRIRVCMERAKLLLGDFGMTAGECAEALGFHDVSYFCRRFRREFGMSPSEFKKRCSTVTDEPAP